MRDTELYVRLRGLGMPQEKAKRLTAHIRDVLHPVAAVASAKVLRAAGSPPATTLSGNTAAAVKYGSTGASIGSQVFPGIGTIVGAVVGIIAGYAIKTGQKPQRLADARTALAQLRQLSPDFAGRLISDHDFEALFFALFLASGWHSFEGSRLLDHPTSLHNLSQAYQQTVMDIVKAAAANPVGATVTVPMMTAQGGSSSPINPPFQFVNPGLNVGAYAFTQSVLIPMIAARNLPYGPARIAELQSNIDAQHVLALLFDHDQAIVAPDNTSTTLANAVVAPVPQSIVNSANQVAAQYLAQGSAPVLAQPMSSTPTGYSGQNPIPQLPLQTINAPAGVGYNAANVPVTAYGPMPINQVLTPQQDTTAGMMQEMLAANGTNMQSPAAQQVLADVAAQGVETTGQIPKNAPAGSPILPLGIVGALALLR